jgi:hypothetical protein
MTADTATPSRHDPEIVERGVLEAVLPEPAAPDARGVGPQNDSEATIPRGDDVAEAIGGLVRSGLLRDHSGTVVPTHAATRFAELFELP